MIIPVHNASKTITETVYSIFHQQVPAQLLKENGHAVKEPFYDASATVYDDDHSNHHSIKQVNESYEILDTYSRYLFKDIQVNIAICCFDDGSTDDSWSILLQLQQHFQSEFYHKKRDQKMDWNNRMHLNNVSFHFQMILGRPSDGIARGAATARNRAVQFNGHSKDRGINIKTTKSTNLLYPKSNFKQEACSYLCFIDSDDIMHPHRIAHQLSVMLAMSPSEQEFTLLGCTFDRIPQDSTWHYTQWANTLSDERLVLEQFREITVIQPTWFMTRSRFESLGGYIEASSIPSLSTTLVHEKSNHDLYDQNNNDHSFESSMRLPNQENRSLVYVLVHEQYDTFHTIKLAEDLRFFYAHLSYPYQSTENDTLDTVIKAGSIKLIKTSIPLMTYRHRQGQSQSSMTSRKLLIRLRVKAFMDLVVGKNLLWQCHPTSNQGPYDPSNCASNGFVIWGAGRDGKDFFKSLSWNEKRHVRCFVDVDEKKIQSGYYVVSLQTQEQVPPTQKRRNDETLQSYKLPIVHFSMLIRDDGKRNEVQQNYIYGKSTFSDHVCDSIIDGRITKAKIISMKDQFTDSTHGDELPPMKKTKLVKQHQRKLFNISEKDLDNRKLLSLLPQLPVVVCVAMYRSNGALERNVECIGRKEGVDLWHFS